MNSFKKIFAFVLSLCMVLSFVPVSVFAADGDATEATHSHEGMTAWTDTNSLPHSGNYYLDVDVTLTAACTIETGTLNLCLNDHVVNVSNKWINNQAGSSVTVNLYDCGTTVRYYTPESNGKWVLNTDNTETAYSTTGGIIYGGSGSEGGGICVNQQAVWNMYGGNIVGNYAEYGGGVMVENTATFNLYDGHICGNTANSYGGGVYYNSGSFHMYGGEIHNNQTVRKWSNGGGVYANVAFNMSGGKISGNSSHYGGGVYVKDGNKAFTMTGGEISNNMAVSKENASGYGGGVYVEGSGSSFTLSGGTISNNSATGSGGGVGVAGSFTMTGGTISGNSTAGNGGGVMVNGNAKFSQSSGTISGNRATGNGGGVMVDPNGTYTLSGGTISGNSATGNGGGVCLSGSLTMTGGTISENTANWGGGVMMNNNAAFSQSSGSITQNSAKYGGGVFMNGGAVYTLSGGSITSNTATTTNSNPGGGIGFVTSGTTTTVNLSGDPVVKDNTVNGSANNINMWDTHHVLNVGQMEDGADVHLRKGNGTVSVGEGVDDTDLSKITDDNGAGVMYITDAGTANPGTAFHHHNWVETTVAPTCTTAGGTTTACSICTMSTTVVSPATGHTDTDGDHFCEKCGAGSPYCVDLDNNGYCDFCDIRLRSVELHVGDTVTLTDNTGNHEDDYTHDDLDASIATVAVSGTVVPEKKTLSEPVTEIESGKQYILLYNDNNTKVVTNQTGVHTVGHTGLRIQDFSAPNDNNIWTLVGANGTFTMQDTTGKYVNLGAYSASLSETSQNLEIYRPDGAAYWHVRYGDKDDGIYLHNDETTHTIANGWQMSNPAYHPYERSATRWIIKEVITTPATDVTEITVEALSVGRTSVVVGGITYSINVTPVPETVDVYMAVNDTKSLLIDGYDYTNDIRQNPDADIAEMTVSVHTPADNRTEVSQLESGRKYLIVDNGKAVDAYSEPANVLTPDATDNFLDINGNYTTSAVYWVVEKVPDKENDYYIMTPDGKYLSFNTGTASVTADKTAVTLTYTSGTNDDRSGWTLAIGEGNYLDRGTHTTLRYAAYGGPSGDLWDFYEYNDQSSTQVTFTGKTIGKTTAQVGHVTYNVTVVQEVVDVSDYVGKTYTDTTHTFTTTGDNADDPSASIASVSWTADGVTIVGNNAGNTQFIIENILYNITVKPYEKNFYLVIGQTQLVAPDAAVTQAELDAFNDAYGNCVTVELTADGMLAFTGKAEGVVNLYLLAGSLYQIYITPNIVDKDESYFLGGQSDAEGYGDVIAGLELSTDTTYDLTAADAAGNVTWSSSNTDLFTVTEDGTVVTKSEAGVGYLTITMDNDETQTIPVIIWKTVRSTRAANNERIIDFYNAQTENCSVYYSYNGTELYNMPEGYQIYMVHSADQTDLITFYAAPNDGYALVSMYANTGTFFHSVTNSDGTGYTTDNGIHSDEVQMKDGGYQSLHDQLIAYVVNGDSKAADVNTVHALLEEAVKLEVDGGFHYSRRANDTSDASGELTFIAEELPEVDQTVEGVLGTSLLQRDWRVYEDGMYADVGEVLFFDITVTQTAPIYTTEVVKDGVTYYQSHLVYSDAQLVDNALSGAYFYTYELDTENGSKYDGKIDNATHQLTTEDITADLNALWTKEQLDAGKRELSYYVVYQIQDTDVGKEIDNSVAMTYTYSSTYSHTSATSEGTADASMSILGAQIGDILVDFALPVVMTGLTTSESQGVNNIQLPGVTAENLTDVIRNTNNAQGGCMFGTVDMVMAEDGTVTLTYTPNQVMTTYDVIYIMDAENNLLNYIRVRPASTIYYEESFATFGTANPEGDPSWTGHDEDVTGTQEYQYANCTAGHEHNNFGYDDKYAAETGMSNGTQAVSTAANDTATFTFNGDGFELYANCDVDTSNMTVMLYRVTYNNDESHETLVKFMQVITKTANPDYTDGNQITNVKAEGLPLVSVNNLEHGTYKVVIRHTKHKDDTEAEIRLDGFRVFHTIKDNDTYYPEEERNTSFTELRDEVLHVAGVTSDSDQAYTPSNNPVTSNANVIFVRDDGADWTKPSADEIAEAAQDWLDNGPKNEIWMVDGDALAFTLAPTVESAQIGLKAPSGVVTCTITMKDAGGTTTIPEKTYTITSATDMFYDLPDVGERSLAGLTVVITVTSAETVEADESVASNIAMLSVTKLKTKAADTTNDVTPALAEMNDLQVASVLDLIYGGDETVTPGDELENNTVTRIYGDNRFETAFKVADELKSVLGVEKFENIIIASGASFADALSGSYLAAVKNAPILLSFDDTYNELVRQYIAENLAQGGTVYILGGSAAVAETVDAALIADGVSVKRLAGADRFATNLAILAEAGVENQEILVCNGTGFADSLSASAAAKPILLVYNELSDDQAQYLNQLNACTFTVIGGQMAVSAELEAAVGAYGAVQRLAGANRFETSVVIAERYFTSPETVVLASAANYPDGLCGGVLAHAMNAPLVLTMTGAEEIAADYVAGVSAKSGVVLGGESLISDGAVFNIYSMTADQTILVK